MVAVSLIAGIGLLLAGLLAIAFGIPVKEFSFGNTLILVGAVAACTGILMLGLWTVVRQLKDIAQRLGAAPDDQASERAGAATSATASSPPWHEQAGSPDRGRSEVGPAQAGPEPEEAPPPKPRRNLLFSSISRKERERAQARTEPAVVDSGAEMAAPLPVAQPDEPPPANFDDAWPKPERARTTDAPPRRGGRTTPTFTEGGPGAAGFNSPPPAPASENRPAVTVLKSGVVDGMAYSLYSDGSIEAQMPEGMMRFASIEELRSHLDQRP